MHAAAGLVKPVDPVELLVVVAAVTGNVQSPGVIDQRPEVVLESAGLAPMAEHRILLVEDDDDVADGMVAVLEAVARGRRRVLPRRVERDYAPRLRSTRRSRSSVVTAETRSMMAWSASASAGFTM